MLEKNQTSVGTSETPEAIELNRRWLGCGIDALLEEQTSKFRMSPVWCGIQ